MKTITYRVIYDYSPNAAEFVRVQARSVNSGYAKALKAAREPLGNGVEREIMRIEFSQVEL